MTSDKILNGGKMSKTQIMSRLVIFFPKILLFLLIALSAKYFLLGLRIMGGLLLVFLIAILSAWMYGLTQLQNQTPCVTFR